MSDSKIKTVDAPEGYTGEGFLPVNSTISLGSRAPILSGRCRLPLLAAVLNSWPLWLRTTTWRVSDLSA